MNAPLHRARTERGLTQVQLSAASGVPQRTISDFDRGRVPRTVVIAAKLARACGISLDEMFAGAADIDLDSDDAAHTEAA